MARAALRQAMRGFSLTGLLRRFGPTMLVTFISQGVSALSLLSIALLGAHTSDAYSLGIQIGTSALSGVVLQVLYLVAIGRPWFRSWRAWGWIGAAFSVVLSVAIALFNLATPSADESVPMVLIFGVGGAFLALGGVISVRLACAGRPVMMAGSTIPPNAALLVSCLAVFVFGSEWTGARYAPAVAWTVAAFGAWLFLRRLDMPEIADPSMSNESRKSEVAHTAALSVGLVSNTIFPSLYVATLTQLQTGTTTIVFFVSRIGNSVVGLFVNSVLAVRHNWNGQASSLAPVAQAFSILATAGCLAAFGLVQLDLDLVSYLALVLGWIASIIAAPLVLREMNAERMVRAIGSKTVVDLALAGTLGTWFLLNPSVTGFFGVNIAGQGIALITGGIALKKRYLIFGAVPLFLVGIALVILGW